MADLAGEAAIDPNMEIAGLTADSRRVAPGWLFAALPGAARDGRAYMADAVARGAALILAPPGTAPPAGAALVTDPNPRRRLALLAARFHGRQPRAIAAVTGTNGKTSVAVFARQLWAALGRPAASLGTLGLEVEGAKHAAPSKMETTLTTPDPVALHACLAALAAAGVQNLALEASSHGLAQFRLDGVRLRAAAFTNLGRDHLDYHASRADYLAAKQRLFTEILPEGACAVLNADAPETPALAAAIASAGRRVETFGRKGARVRLRDAARQGGGQHATIAVDGRAYAVTIPLIGLFQLENALAALGLVLACGAPVADSVAALARLAPVRGRLELAGTHVAGAPVYVDYAHAPDALEAALRALRSHYRGARLVVVFGAGGDRDTGKRPMMGAVAARAADHVIVTDDNPRGENPAAIRRAILAACPGAEEIGARADAIRHAVFNLSPGDVLLVAGKGHEQGQIVGGVTLPFDDVSAVRAALAARDGGAP